MQNKKRNPCIDTARFDAIKDVYTRRRRKLLIAGRFQRPTKAGYWATSNPDHIFELFRTAGLERYKSFVDLGSGDGIVTAMASLFTRSSGIEIDPALHREAADIMSKLGITCNLHNGDFLDADLSQYDIIFINPDNYFHRLEKKLVEGFRGDIIIADNIFRPLTLKPIKEFSIRGANYSLFRVKK
ncbi:class I SAM-dependent methyltransferase [Candidatus Woesearchaeota archaeon]|nr:class I SAM-dependent methyltransferase [Candidatus Woesearchaeota archaeon]